MADESTPTRGELLALTAEIVSAHLSNNPVSREAVPDLIPSVFGKLTDLAGGDAPSDALTPAVPIGRSVTDDYIVCLEDGFTAKMLKRHLQTAHNMTPEEYRAKWGLKPDYPDDGVGRAAPALRAGFHLADQRSRGGGTLMGDVLANRRQFDHTGEFVIVDADQRDVATGEQAPLAQRHQRAERHLVGHREARRGWPVEVEQFRHGLSSAFDGEVPGRSQRRVDIEAGSCHTLDEALPPSVRLRYLLEELDLTPLAKSKAYQLSGGEKRRLEITRALVTGPKLLLLDEPFAGIDPIAVHEVQKILRRLRDRGLGILITDHGVRELLKLIDRGYIIHHGKVLCEGSAEFLANDRQAREIYLGPDFNM
jgi:predicted transcriptional regulator